MQIKKEAITLQILDVEFVNPHNALERENKSIFQF